MGNSVRTNAPSSNVLQTVSTILTSRSTVTLTTAKTWYNITDGTTTMAVTITPQSASSKLLIIGHLCTIPITGTGANYIGISDGTNIITLGDTSGSRTRGGLGVPALMTGMGIFKMLNSGSTSSRTYTVQAMNVFTNSASIRVNSFDGGASDANTQTALISTLSVIELNV